MTSAIIFRHEELGYPQRRTYAEDRTGRVLTSDIVKGQPNIRLYDPNAENELTLNFTWSTTQLQIFEVKYSNDYLSGEVRVLLTVMNGGVQQTVIGYFGVGYSASYIGVNLFNVSMRFFVETNATLPIGSFSSAFSDGFVLTFGG